MKYIISGTNRPGSRSFEVAKIYKGLFDEQSEASEIIDLKDLQLHQLTGAEYGSDQLPASIQSAVQKTKTASGLVVICPEYNGSMPGALKLFIDYWKYPESFEYRPICMAGLGGKFGGLRPVEHLQQVFGYRNAFVYPERVFLTDIFSILKNGQIQDERIMGLIKSQVSGFNRFVKALDDAGLSANTRKK